MTREEFPEVVEELAKSLDPLEQALCKKFALVRTRGKKGCKYVFTHHKS
jgi:hypothetical protein